MLGNWLRTCRKAGIDADRVIVAALDSATYDWCVEEVKLYVDFNFHCTKAAQGVLKLNSTARRGGDNTFRDDRHSFHAVTRAKVHCITALLRNGYDVALSDVDVAWQRDPKDYFNTGQLGVTDVAMSADFVFHFETGVRVFYEHEKNGHDGFQAWRKYHKNGQNPWPFHSELNTGMMFWRCTKSAIRFAIDWSEKMDSERALPRHDQAHFNDLFHSPGSRKSAAHEAGLIRAFCKSPVVENEDNPCVKPKDKCPLELSCDYSSYGQGLDELEDDIEGACPYDACERGQADADLNGTLAKDFVAGFRPLYSYGGSSGSVRFALLPTELFGNGMTYFVKGRNASPHAFAVHNTYVYSGYTSKIWRFREAGLWLDDKDAFIDTHKQDEKTLVVRFNVPPELEEASRSSVATPRQGIPEGHMRALAWQADRLRDAFAIAIITNRTLILPQLLCGCHRHFYFMNNCTLGDHDIPFACPMDHVLRLIKFGSGALHEFRVREANYFENRIAAGLSRLPAAPRVVFCDHEKNFAACAARDGRVAGAVTKTAGYLPTKVDIDESKAAAVLTKGASAADVLRAFSAVERAPVVVLDGLGASSAGGADFLSFGAPERDRWFDERVREVFHPWCCAAEKLGGEIPINITALIKA
ncbi:nucleotide-diphospho-sugar transferase-domain-containing protein [Ostreococcus tauri]|uniref:Nucleotide-diphospho-sugar transferase-domain-containing protein n=1 Tax=Ostreococcus tauri TaxID=70448 RepID=A0A1Y5IHP5_OSTTA|nr:nucleotide-diphospho-sugar transferase-domain-containing protein [Ostreococcus tauri]